MTSGKQVFITRNGVEYILDKYLTPGDRDELRYYNNGHGMEKFKEELIKKLERGSNSRNWIPSNYEDELVENAAAIIGTNRRREKLKNGREVDVYTARGGGQYYEDRRGNVRDFRSGRFAKKTAFVE